MLNSNCDKLQILVSLGADVSGTTDRLKASLLSHSLCREFSISKYLLDHGAHYDKPNSHLYDDSEIPLHAAIFHLNIAALKKLIKKGANL